MQCITFQRGLNRPHCRQRDITKRPEEAKNHGPHDCAGSSRQKGHHTTRLPILRAIKDVRECGNVNAQSIAYPGQTPLPRESQRSSEVSGICSSRTMSYFAQLMAEKQDLSD